RMADMLLERSPSRDVLEQTLLASRLAEQALARLEREARDFDTWRRERAAEREERDQHSLLREYLAEDCATGLIEARGAYGSAGSALETALAELAEHLDSMPLRNRPALRRTLELAREEIVEAIEAIDAWMPIEEGAPALRASVFHDVEP